MTVLPSSDVPTRATRHALVLAGGDPVPAEVAAELPSDAAVVIAADSGLHLAAGLGLRVDLVVGDLDSVDPAVLAAAEAAGARVERHPAAKDATDLELALDAAVAADVRDVTVVGGAGGRLDHELALWSLVAAPAYAGVTLRLRSARSRAVVVRGGDAVELTGRTGEVVSLLPIHGDARAVTTTGLRFRLTAEDLPAGSTRGVSNELATDRATVALGGGVLLAVLPGEDGPGVG